MCAQHAATFPAIVSELSSYSGRAMSVVYVLAFFLTLACAITAATAAEVEVEVEVGDAPALAPCTPRKVDEAAPNCTRVVIPGGLCAACALRPVRADGGFVDCERTYDVQAAACRGALRAYAAANACDPRRAALLRAWDAGDGAAASARLDYFVYALCELGCDAVPTGARAGEYAQRREATVRGARGGVGAQGLWNVRRGNAAAHFVYDVCVVFPRFAHFVLPLPCGARQERAAAARAAAGGGGVCAELRRWVDSADGRNWVARDDVNISAAAQAVIEDAMWALQAHHEQTWRRCVPMEAAQGRI